MTIDRAKWAGGAAAGAGLALGFVILSRLRRPAVVSGGTIAFLSACLTAVAAIVLVVLLLRRGREAFRPAGIDFVYFAAVGWAWLSFLLLARDRGRVGEPFLLLAGLTVYVLVRVAGRSFLDRRRNLLASVFVVLAALEAGRGIRQLAAGAEMRGSFFNANHWAMFLSLAAPAALALAWSARRPWTRIFWFVPMGLFLVGIGLSECRSALAAAVIALGLMATFGLRRRKKADGGRGRGRDRLLAPISLLGGLALIGVLTFSFKPLSTVGRILTWKVSARVFLAHPALGTGFSTFPVFYNPAQGDFFSRGSGSAAERLSASAGNYAFNDYLQTALELGLPGLVLMAVLGSLVLRAVLASLRSAAADGIKSRGAMDSAASVSVLAYLILSLFYYPSRILPIFLLFNFFLAWVVNASLKPAGALVRPPAENPVSRSRKERGRNGARIAGAGFALASLGASIVLMPSFLRDLSAERGWARAQALSRTGREAEALDLCRSLRPRLESDPDFLVYFGRLLLRAGRAGEAVRALETRSPSRFDPFVLEKLAIARKETGSLEAAERAALQASNILPWRLTSKAELADIALRRDDPARARAWAVEILGTPMKTRTAEGTALKRKALELWKRLGPGRRPGEALPAHAEAALLLPDRFQAESLAALDASGPNAGELIRAIRLLPPEERPGIGFLLANMPDRDLRTLGTAFLAGQVSLAYVAWKSLPLAASVPEDVFLNYILPYSVVNESRENWRQEFYERFASLAAASSSVEDAVIDLNLNLVVQYRLSYRERDNRKRVLSPFQTLKAGTVSCGEASLLLVAACRSVGIPARLVVLRRWAHMAAGHVWAEVYDRGRWRHLVGYDAGRLDETWMEPYLDMLNPADPAQHIFASSFARTGIHIAFGSEVSFTDVTDAYRRTSGR
jgi:O-antigen ligase